MKNRSENFKVCSGFFRFVGVSEHVIIFLMMMLLFLCISGCTEYERAGYSAIPQNSPAGWELAPYGDLRN